MPGAPRRDTSGEPSTEPVVEPVTADLEDALRIAARLLAVDRCVMGVVSPRDGWLRSVVGVSPDEARSFLGVCSFAMMQPAAAVIPDARAVGALAALPPFRTGEHRWLVAAPLIAPSGAKRGGLAALHRAPRAWTTDDAEMLEAVCRQMIAHIERGRSIEELRRRGQHQAAVISTLRGVLKASTTTAIVATDLSGRINLFSEGAERMFGLSAREAIGRTAACLLPDEEPGADRFSSLIAGVSQHAPHEKTRLLRRSDGARFPALIAAACITTDGGEPAGYALIARDVTEERAVERMKDDFVSMVSHELRTPLTSIRGALGLVRGGIVGPVSEPADELIHIAHANSERLLRLVNDILDMQRLASDRIDLAIAPFDVHDAASRAIELVRPVASERAVMCALRRRAASGVVEADFDRIVQVLVNLLSNAVRYSPPSSHVHVDIDDRPAGVLVAVEDEGPGVPEEFRARLFQKFARAAQGSDAPQGTGLGLSIVKALVDLHGGAAGFRPAPSGGSVFYFELPREHAPPGSKRLR